MTRPARILIHTIFLLALAEGAARVAEWVHPPVEDVTFGYAPYRMLKMTKAPWALNRAGFRAKDWDAYGDTFRIEFLGGSVCLGVGTNPGRTLPERLEDALRAAGLEKASVLNLCQAGATSGQELAIFLEYGLPLKPQVVLSFDGANDLMHPRPIGQDDAPNLPYKNAEMQSLFEGQGTLAVHLALVRVAVRWRNSRAPIAPSQAAPAVPVDAILDSYFYSANVVRTLTEAQGGLYGILFQPTLHFEKPWSREEEKMWRERSPREGADISRAAREIYTAATRRLRNRAAGDSALVFDLTRVFAHTPETIYSDSVHFEGERGYAMLAAEVVKQGLVDLIAARYRQWSAGIAAEQTLGEAWQGAR